MATVNEQLEAMRTLGENWDGYQAAPPGPSVLDLAQQLVGLIEHMLQQQKAGSILHVSPTRTGGVLIEWQNRLLEHEVEISSDGAIGFLHRHSATGQINTRHFAPQPGVVQAGFLQELRQSLAA
ncbi:MAG: hypothetical protein K2R98_10155 [Gemmataceae bacterium]|nr:hypothetical protein [Gemmataceae bacterium]